VVGAVAEGLVKRLPAVERLASPPQAMQAVQEDAVLYKVFKDTTNHLVKKRLTLSATSVWSTLRKKLPPAASFQGMTVEMYRDRLTQGAIDRAKFLWDFADGLYKTAETWTPELANSFRQGLYASDFFKQRAPHTAGTPRGEGEISFMVCMRLGQGH